MSDGLNQIVAELKSMQSNMHRLSGIVEMSSAIEFIDRASLGDCYTLSLALGNRLFKLAGQSDTTQGAANLDEAAHMMADVALNIGGAQNAAPDEVCECGKCDSCRAAVSDILHDRNVDEKLLKECIR